MADMLRLLASFLYDRWLSRILTPKKLEALQEKGLRTFLTNTLPRAAFYAGRSTTSLINLPITDKSHMRAHFEGMNTIGLELKQAEEVALAAEASRDFAATINGVTVGLSSGTSGQRGIFLVTRSEQLRWAGIMLSKVLAPSHLRQILCFWQRPLEVAFFLRSNSNLYQSASGRRARLHYYDLQQPIAHLLKALNHQQPDILIAPASVLAQLAESQQANELHITPSRIISVAEVLEGDDCMKIERVFGIRPQQLYQATEGFLAYTCPHGSLHLNERYVHIEPEWLDEQHERFVPIITDFSRTTQIIARHRLNDVLRMSKIPCACGCPERTIAEIEGRCDDVLYLPSRSGDIVPVFPDSLRHALFLVGSELDDYRLVQTNEGLECQLKTQDIQKTQAIVQTQLEALWQTLDVLPPSLFFKSWSPPLLINKRRRITRLAPRPEPT